MIDPDKTVEVRLTDETIDYLEQRLTAALTKAVKSSIDEEAAKEFWGAGLKVLREQATEHTGRFVLGGLWGLARKLGMFLALGGVVYAIGGWSALAKLWSVIFTGPPA